MSVKRKWRHIIQYSSLCIFLLVTLAIAAVWINKKVIVAEAVSLIERRTGADLHFDKARLRFTFPFTGIYLDQVNIRNSKGETWLHASKVFMRLNPWSLLKDDYKFPYLKIEKARLVHTIDTAGQSNLPFQQSTAQKRHSDGKIGIKRIRIEDLSLQIRDDLNELYTHIDLQKADLGISIENGEVLIDMKGALHSRYISTKAAQFALDFPLHIDAEALFLPGQKSLEIIKGLVQTEKNGLYVNGAIAFEPSQEHLDIAIRSEDFQPDKWLRILPPDLLPAIERYDIRASCETELRLDGTFEEVRVQWSNQCRQLLVDNIWNDRQAQCQTAVFSFSKGSNDKAEIDIQYLKCQTEGIQWEGSGKLQNLNDPTFDGVLSGEVELNKVLAEFESPVYCYGGRLLVDTLKFDNITLLKARLFDPGISVRFTLAELDLEYGDFRSVWDQGGFSLEKGLLSWDQCTVSGEGMQLKSSGYVPLIAASDHPEYFDIHLEGKSLDLLEVMALIPESNLKENQREVSSKKTTSDIAFPGRGHLSFSLDQLKYKDVVADNAQGHLTSNPGSLEFLIESDYAQGDIHAIGKYEYKNDLLKAKVKTFGCELSELFRQWDDFGQKTLTYRHISGRFDGWYDIRWHKWAKDDLSIYAALDLSDGRLKDFSLMEQFSSYIHAEDLKDIRLSRLRNMFVLESGELTIPRMFIQSNAANLSIAGEHTLDNEMRYYIRLNAGQVLMEKMKAHDTSLHPLKPNKKGLINLHYSILGPMDNFVYYRDKKDVKKYFNSSVDVRMKIRNKLIRSFPNIPDWVDTDIWDDIPENEINEQQYLEWDGN